MFVGIIAVCAVIFSSLNAFDFISKFISGIWIPKLFKTFEIVSGLSLYCSEDKYSQSDLLYVMHYDYLLNFEWFLSHQGCS